MKIERFWSMPNPDTFSITPIKKYLEDIFSNGVYGVDPFVRNSPFKNNCLSNDLDETINADEHKDAVVFLKGLISASYDLVLFDPPYSPRQLAECYKKMKLAVNMETTQSSFWSNCKKEISRIIKKGGRVISFGWNSGGIGKKYGFEIEYIMLIAHGGQHNDTIMVVERRV